MSRDISTEMQAVADAEVVRPFYLLELEFDGGTVRLWSGLGDLDYGGNTYVGAGNLLSVSPITESSDLQANGASFTLNGATQELVALARDEEYQGRPITMMIGAFDESGNVVSSPVVVFGGFMDVMTITDSGESDVISLSAENKLIAFERARIRRFTDQDQKLFHPGDKGLEFVTSVQEKQILWGA